MALQVYDFREDIRHLLVTPHIRCRFMPMKPGDKANLHSHDLGHEIFLMLQGRARFVISGEEAVVGPGQLCIALADEPHTVETVGDEPVIMYLSVTPHVQPTHTNRTEDGAHLPHDFQPSANYQVEADMDISEDELLDRLTAASAKLAEIAGRSADVHRQSSERIKEALSAGDGETAAELRNSMWNGVCETFTQLYSLSEIWNEVAPRAPQRKSGD